MIKTIINLLFLLLLLFLTYSCSEETPVTPKAAEYCPPPYDTTLNGIPSPIVTIQKNQKISPDGKKLLFTLVDSRLSVLYLKTGIVQNIDFQEKLPPHIKYVAVSKALWCPYNSNRLLAQIVTQTDTVGDGKRYEWGANLYIIHLKENQIECITPDFVGKAGFYPTNFGIAAWMPESREGYDKIRLAYSNPKNQGQVRNYIVQTQEMFEPEFNFTNISKDGRYYYSSIKINGNSIKLKDNFGVKYSSFSPDGRKLALSVQISAVENGQNIPYYLQRFSEVWIIDVEKFLREKPDTAIYPDKIINYRKAFCMYNYEAGYAEFITKDRLAVSMFHTVYDGYGFLYEITEDGRMVRQLTFEP